VLINLVIVVILTVIFRAAKVPQGADETLPHQYTAELADAPVLTPAGVGLSAAGPAGTAGAAGDLP
jgi:solute:Na+ symporter, SSS family